MAQPIAAKSQVNEKVPWIDVTPESFTQDNPQLEIVGGDATEWNGIRTVDATKFTSTQSIWKNGGNLGEFQLKSANCRI